VIGAAPEVVTSPIRVGGSAAPGRIAPAPAATSWFEEVYEVHPADSYAKISKQKFATEAYAAALQEFNRRHPQASPAVQRGDGTLAPGERLFIPQAELLEKRYPSLIPRPAAGAAPAEATQAFHPGGTLPPR
jgi:hypothetical protein